MKTFSPKIEEVLKKVAGWKKHGLKITVASGCFDLLHVGHIRYLQESKTLGDKLIVLVSDDVSVQMLKGKARPIIPEQQRSEMLYALAAVDEVIVHKQEDLLDLLEQMAPHTFTKGKDYPYFYDPSIERLVGKISLVGDAKAISTSEIIHKCFNNLSQK